MRDPSAAFPAGKGTDSDSELQRLRAEVSRYRKLIYALTAVLAVFLLAGIIGSAVMANHARRLSEEVRLQEERAREQEEVATAVKDLLVKDLLELSESPPKTDIAQ